jgi:hypothetical protein
MRTLAYLGVVSLGVLACSKPGDRVNGGCPPGETCSPKVEGLFFVGAKTTDELFEGGPGTLALGGTQSVYVVTGASVGSPALALPFDALSSHPDILGIVSEGQGAEVVVSGIAAGNAYLRIVDAGTNLLFDRLAIGVQEVDSVRLRPVVSPFGDMELATNVDSSFALWDGTDAQLYVHLLSTGGRLVDESLGITATGFSAAQQGEWDRLDVTTYGGTAATVSVVQNGVEFPFTVDITGSADEIIWVEGISDTPPSDPIPAGTARIYCFRAVSNGRAVVGAPWSFSADDGIVITQDTGLDNCVSVTAPASGTFTVTPIGAELGEPFTFTVAATKPAAVSKTPSERPAMFPRLSRPGERQVDADTL